MGQANKKENIAALHREAILSAAELLFLEKGVLPTTMDDISKKSAYSRRTIYTYYESKDDILHQIILKGLQALKESLKTAMKEQKSFLERYWAICRAMTVYYESSPEAAGVLNQVKPDFMDLNAMSKAAVKIFEIGAEINLLLADFITEGKKQGVVRADVAPMHTVYVFWGCFSALLSMVQSKGIFLEKELKTSKDNFLEYGFKQMVNAILVERLIL